MKIHEYQAKQLLREAGVAVPAGLVADTPQGVGEAYSSLGGKMAVVEAEIHAGGRGKGTIAECPPNAACNSSAAATKPKPSPPICSATAW